MERFSKLTLAAMVFAGFAATGCSDDDGYSAVDGKMPAIALEQSEVHLEYGMTANIKGKITDADGIRSINIKNSDLYLNKTIDILKIYGDSKTEYDLDYNVTPNDTLTIESFPLQITVEDLVGNTATATFTAKMDGDFTAPKFILEPNDEINVIMPVMTFKFSVSDNKGITYCSVEIPDLDYKQEYTGGDKNYEFVEKLNLGDENRDYTGKIIAYDAFNNTLEKEFTISKSELKDYAKMYLCDVAEADLIADVCGVPMLIDHSGEFEYTAYYFNAAAGTEIRFIPQNNSYGPICFSLDPTNHELLTADPDQGEPLVLDKAGVYYKIVLNTKQGTYSTSTYTIDEAVDPLPAELGSNSLNTWWTGTWNPEIGEWEGADDAWWQEFKVGIMTDNPKDVEPLFEYNPQNKHIIQVLGYELPMGKFEFHPHNWHHDGWWDYTTWKPEAATEADPEIWRYVGGVANPAYNNATTSYNNEVEVGNHAKLTIPKAGKYDFIFDMHLGRMKVVPSK